VPTPSQSRTIVGFVVVLVTVPDPAVGDSIARALLDAKLAACVNRLGPVRSLFRWKGKVDAADEHLLLIKARADRLDAVAAAVAKLHPYEVPEVLALPVAGGSGAYLRWLEEETAG
jgi:periplasmic divalent cation tolerance protein